MLLSIVLIFTAYLFSFFDMKNNVLPKTMISKIKSLIREGARVQKELSQWYLDQNVSDSEAEINEEELMHSMTLKRKLEKLQAKMEMLENPVIRYQFLSFISIYKSIFLFSPIFPIFLILYIKILLYCWCWLSDPVKYKYIIHINILNNNLCYKQQKATILTYCGPTKCKL